MDLIVKMKFGSHLYGTDTEKSDVDYKGGFLPSKQEILLGDIPKCWNFSTNLGGQKNSRDDIDEEIYSLHYFLKMACQGQTVAMDMLHALEDMLLNSSEIWQSIVKQRSQFYTKNLNSFIDYARRQASKYGIKGSRLNAAAQVLNCLKSNEPDAKLRDVWDQLPRNDHCQGGYTGSDQVNQLNLNTIVLRLALFCLLKRCFWPQKGQFKLIEGEQSGRRYDINLITQVR